MKQIYLKLARILKRGSYESVIKISSEFLFHFCILISENVRGKPHFNKTEPPSHCKAPMALKSDLALNERLTTDLIETHFFVGHT